MNRCSVCGEPLRDREETVEQARPRLQLQVLGYTLLLLKREEVAHISCAAGVEP